MEAAEVIALVSVVSGAVVSIGTPWITARLGLARFELETSRGREEELREHLDAATIRLSDARIAVVKAMTPLLRVHPMSAKDTATQVYGMFELPEQLAQLRKNADRPGVRLGSVSPVTQQYNESVEGIQQAIDVVAEMMGGAPLTQALADRMENGLKAAIAAQDRFHDAASALIGVSASGS